MAADAQFRDQVLESLAPLGGVSFRSMFGGFGIFADGEMFALISGSAIFFKADDSNRSRYEEAGSKRHGSMPYYRVPSDVLEDRDKLVDWARASVAVARATPKKRR